MTEMERWMSMYSSTSEKVRKCTENMTLDEIHNNLIDLEEIFEEYKKIEELKSDIDRLLEFCKESEDATLFHIAVVSEMVEQYKERTTANRKRLEEVYNRFGFVSDLI